MKESNQPVKVLQVCRLTHEWGMDLFAHVTKACQLDNKSVTTVFISGRTRPDLKSTYHGNIIFLNIDHRKIFWRVKAFFQLLKICRQEKFELVICHHYKPMVIMHFVSLLCGIKKRYVMLHNFGSFAKKRSQRFLQKIKLKWIFVVVSGALKKELLRFHVPENHIIVLYNAIDIHALQQCQYDKKTAREKMALPTNPLDFIFGTLGRLSHEKGHHDLIQAFLSSPILMNKNVLLVIIGTGPLHDELTHEIKSIHADNKIKVITNVAKTGAIYLKAFDVFVMPSIDEAFGIVLLEAMCAKLPIIASKVGGIPEAVGDSVQLIEPKNIDSLKKAMEKYFLMSQNEREKLGEAGYSRLFNHFGIESYYAEIKKKILYTLPNTKKAP